METVVMSLIKKVLIFFGVIIGVIIIFNSVTFTTYSNEYNVVRQFGEVKRIVTEPGITFKTPFIQSVYSIPKNLQYYDLPMSDVITSDKKTMVVDAYITWKISDPKKFIQSLNASLTSAEGRIDVIAYNAIKRVCSTMTQDELIRSRDNSKLTNTTEELLDSKDLAQLILDTIGTTSSEYGIEICQVEVKKLDLPNENKAAVYTRMITERENIAASYTAQGDSEAQIIKNETNKEASIMLSEAEKQAKLIVAEGEAEYMKILSEAYNDENKADFYKFVRALEAAKTSLVNGENTLILSEDSPLAQIFNGNFETE